MLTFLRMHLALLPMLLSLFLESSPGAADHDKDKDKGLDKGLDPDKPKTFTQDDIDRIFAARLAREKKTLREEIENEVKSAAEKAKLEADGKLQEVLDKERAEKRDLAAQMDARDAQERERVLRYEIRDAARDLNFADADDAYHLIDRASVQFGDDGTPTNVPALVKALSEKKPHLVRAEQGPRGGRETPRPANVPAENLGESFIKSRYGTKPTSP